MNTLKDQDWPRIIKELTLYANSRLKYWGLVKNKRLKGNTAKDIAFNAIEAVLSGRWNWDPAKSDLIFYLKFHVVRGMVANLAKDTEIVSSSEDELSDLNLDSKFSQEDEYNSSQVIAQILITVKNEVHLPEIVDLLSKGLKRSDICETMAIDLTTYDNALKRLRSRILRLDKTGVLKKIV